MVYRLPIDIDAKPINKNLVERDLVEACRPGVIGPPYDINWPPDYRGIAIWKTGLVNRLRKRSEKNPIGDPNFPSKLSAYKLMYKHDPVKFIVELCETYDPRNAGLKKPVYMPFVLFKRQEEFIRFVYECLKSEQNGLVEKSRDMGATWLCVAISVHLWLFEPGIAIGWGSRKQELVDNIGDPDSILEKIRITINRVPPIFHPQGFDVKRHMSHMRIINPENDASITGEIGDNIGRGGRKRIYFKDESAHYEHAVKIEAALSENTRCQIDISSVSGLGTVFHNKREAGVDWFPGGGITRGRTNVFIMDWSDHPEKNQQWYEERYKKFEMEGMLHVFAQETGRDYAGAAQGVIIPAQWVLSAVDAHKKLERGSELDGQWMAGLDVADFTESGDTNALSVRKGVILKFLDEWGGLDTGQTTVKAVHALRTYTPIECQYDALGVGAGVKADYNRMVRNKTLPKGIGFIPWNGGGKVLKPDEHVIPKDKKTPLNKDYYQNMKAQAWLQARFRFEKTHKAVTDPRYQWQAQDLISIDKDSLPPHLFQKLKKELSQATMVTSHSLKVMVDKKPDGMKSPNLADSVIMNFWPMPSHKFNIDPLTIQKARMFKRPRTFLPRNSLQQGRR